jgi:hypothetical protein
MFAGSDHGGERAAVTWPRCCVKLVEDEATTSQAPDLRNFRNFCI